MPRVPSRKPSILAFCFLALVVLVSLFIINAHAGIRGPGKYSGVVVFDRWDTCFLFSGPYIIYISERVKDRLRPYKGMAIQVDASDVFQPMNPGDALIRRYEIIGPAPEPKWITLDGLDLIADADFGPAGKPVFVIEIRNAGKAPITVDSSEIGIALLKSEPNLSAPSDGASIAVITRTDLAQPPGWMEEGTGSTKRFWGYTVNPETRPPKPFELAPGQSMRTQITFEISSGQYQFMFGYGGGVHEEKSLGSNSVSFDLSKDGVATLTN